MALMRRVQPRTMAVTPAARLARPRWWPGVVAWALWALVMLGIPVVVWLNHLLHQAGRSDQAGSNVDTIIYLLAAVSAVTVGAVLASRRARHPVGWLLLALGLWFTYGYASYALLAWRGAPPAVGSAAKDVGFFWMAACIGFILLLTPTGLLPSPRWRWWARVAALAAVVGLLSSVLGPFTEPDRSVADPLARALRVWLPVARGVTFVVAGLALPIGAASLVVRFGRARGVERQQLRWLAVGAAPVAVAVLAIAALVLAGNEVSFSWFVGVCLAVLPLAIGAAIQRYRLYDLDRIISRTLAYGLLTVLLGGGYAGVVLGLGQLLGQDSPLVVAAATLAVAAAFQPVRRRVQELVDRRFNRRRYDAARTIQAFSARLRQQVNLEALAAELLGVVEQTMQPASVSLWLRPSVSASPDQRSTGVSRDASQPTVGSPSVRTTL
jgi:hypothetical protein